MNTWAWSFNFAFLCCNRSEEVFGFFFPGFFLQLRTNPSFFRPGYGGSLEEKKNSREILAVYWVVKLLWFNSIDAICSLPLCGYLLVALRCDALKPKMSGQWLLHILVMCSSFSWCIMHASSCSNCFQGFLFLVLFENHIPSFRFLWNFGAYLATMALSVSFPIVILHHVDSCSLAPHLPKISILF